MRVRDVAEICAFVDESVTDATGELIVNDDAGPNGTVFIEGGRVCWAAARGMARRLTEGLSERSRLAPREMESLLSSFKRQRIPLSEGLLAGGTLSAPAFREALLEHTVECLERLCTSTARAAWVPRQGPGYGAQFTFSTSELLTGVGGSRYRAALARAQPILQASFGDDDWGAAFMRTPQSSFPEPIAARGSAPPDAATLIRIGKWAACAVDVAVPEEDAIFTIERTTIRGRASLVAFRHGDLIVAGERFLRAAGRSGSGE